MKALKAGDKVDYTITYLEMNERPSYPRPHLFGKTPSALIHAEAPPNWYFLNLYDAVGRNYEWQDRHQQPEDELSDFVQNEKVHIYTFLRNGWINGFFTIDARDRPTADLAYFGLVPEAVGKGLGTWFIQTAIHTAWDVPETTRVTVNTCTLDHPRALALYQKHGFKPFAQETDSRVLIRDWDPSRFP